MEYAGCGSHGCRVPNPADKRLIKFAPNLLSALETLLATKDLNKKDVEGPTKHAINVAKAAVAKAKGEKP